MDTFGTLLTIVAVSTLGLILTLTVFLYSEAYPTPYQAEIICTGMEQADRVLITRTEGNTIHLVKDGNKVALYNTTCAVVSK